MRDKDVMRARSIRGQSQETPPWTQGSSISDFRAWLHSDLIAAMYEAFQIKLDQARVVRITNTAVDETEETSSDGPGGQEDQ